MNPETPQRCPSCNSVAPKVRGETYHDRRGFLEICGDPFHTAPVPAPFPNGNNLAIGGESGANITEREASPEPPRPYQNSPENCPHNQMMGHEYEQWCVDCGTRWPNYVGRPTSTVNMEPAAAPTGTAETGYTHSCGFILTKAEFDSGFCPRCSEAPTRTGEGSEDRWIAETHRLAEELDKEIKETHTLRSQLAEAQKYNAHFCAAIGPMDEFDTYEDAIQRIKDVRSQLEGAKHAFQQAHMWKMENAKRADKAERDLATAQARIASATTFLRRADATSTQNELYDLVDDTRRALAEPQSGEK